VARTPPSPAIPFVTSVATPPATVEIYMLDCTRSPENPAIAT